MSNTRKKAAVLAAATGALLAAGAGMASASTAVGNTSNSPGVLSGNLVQVPVSIPVNACGDTINVIGLLNPALGNHCGNATNGATAAGNAVNSPGVASGNEVQIPVSIPVYACGDTVSVIGLLNPALGNHCANGGW
jgi:hypothetical protein